MKLKDLIAGGVLLTFMAFYPCPGQGQEPDCGKCFDESQGPDWHEFGEQGATKGCETTECWYEDCHPGEKAYGLCDMTHPMCIPPEDIDHLARGIQEANWVDVRGILERYEGRARFDDDQGSVELLCGGAIAARVEVLPVVAGVVKRLLSGT